MTTANTEHFASRKLAVFAPDIPDRQTLIDNLPRDVAWHVLPRHGDGILALLTLLGGYPPLDALYIVAHGRPAGIRLGDATLDPGNLDAYASVLRSLGCCLSGDGRVHLYSCEVAAGPEGHQFVDELTVRIGRGVIAAEQSLGRVGDAMQWHLGYPAEPAANRRMLFSTTDYRHQLNVPADENYDDDANPTTFSNTNSFTHDGVTYTITGTNGPYSSEISSNSAALSDSVTDLAMLFDTGGLGQVSQIQVDIGGGSFNLASIAFDAIADADVTLSSSAGGNLQYASNGTFVTHDPVDLSANASFQNITSFTFSGGNLVLDIDDLNFEAPNSPPDATGVPTDITVTEDTESNFDLSAVTLNDADGDELTVTISASAGTFTSVADGAGVGAGVTESGQGTATVTLAGSAADISTYLDTATNLRYTGASDASGDNAATYTINADDGTVNPQVGSGNIDITAVNDAPVLDAFALPTLAAINEDAGDDDGSGADGDDDATDNTNNPGSSVASIVVDGSVTDPDGAAVEAVAVTAVDNTNGVWQYSTDNGTSWNNFSGTTGSSVDISSAARLLDGTLTGGSTQKVRFVPDADYNGSATFTFRAWDKTSGSAGGTADSTVNGGSTAFSSTTDTASITVNPVNDLPVLTGLDGTPAFTEGGAAVQLDGNVSVADVELDALNGGNGDYSGASLTIARNGGANANDRLSVESGGSLTVAGGPDGGGTVSAGGNAIATIANTGNGQLQLQFANNGTLPATALLNEVMQAIRYVNASDDPAASVQLDWTFSDGNTGAQGSGGALNDTGSTTVSITNVNDAPTLSATSANPTYIEGAGDPTCTPA